MRTTKEKTELWDLVDPLLRAMQKEFHELQRKKPEATVNVNKCRVANRLLDQVRIILADEKEMAFLDRVNEDDMPQVSDICLMLSQYVAAFDAFRDRYHKWDGSGTSAWQIQPSILPQKKR